MLIFTKTNLSDTIDKNCWMSDDRISACLSLACNGLEQIDFHGSQPVSRNAKILQHPKGVLTFKIKTGNKEYPVSFEKAEIYTSVYGTMIRQKFDQGTLQIKITLYKDSLYITARFKNKNKSESAPKFYILFNNQALSTEIHGDRSWTQLAETTKKVDVFKSTEKIQLDKWLQRTGDYQGDFLIPEGWRKLIFKTRFVSGLGRMKDVWAEYQHSELNIYQADTYVFLKYRQFNKISIDGQWTGFYNGMKQHKTDLWQSDDFILSFSSNQPFNQTNKKPDPTHKKVSARQKKRYKNLAATIPQIECDKKGVSQFFDKTPQIVQSAHVRNIGMTRACPGTYYWIWAWDNLVTAAALARWGNLDLMKSVIDFVRIHRDTDGAIPGRWTRDLQAMDTRGIGALDFLFSNLVLGYYAETLDTQILYSNYPVLFHAFTTLVNRSDENGLYKTIGMYPDLPQKMGRSEDGYVAIDAGAWYCFCRNMEKIARLLKDDRTASQANQMAKKIEANFNLFWDDEKGFLFDSVDKNKIPQVKSYPLFSFLFMESAFGYYLLKDKIHQCADFISKLLITEQGIQQTPEWDVFHTSEPVMSAWYPHWDYPALKLLSQTSGTTAVGKWFETVNDAYTSLGYCPEFTDTNTPPDKKWSRHGAAWNLNCSVGWYQAIIDAMTGVECDLGGITCHSTGDVPEVTIKNLSFRKGKWNISKSGQGNYIKEIRVDNHVIKGCYKIPRDFYTPGPHDLVIAQTITKPPHPVLKALWGAEILNINHSDNNLMVQVNGYGLTDMVIQSDVAFTVHLDDQFLFDSQPQKTEIFHQLELNGTHNLRIIYEAL